MGKLSLVFLTMVGLVSVGLGYYLPGIAPEHYGEGALVDVYADKLYSNVNKVPFDYFSLPFCQEGKKQTLRQQHLNFGEILMGDRDELTKYEFYMNLNETCKVYCEEDVVSKEMQRIRKMIDDDYYVQLNVDNMPAIFWYTVEGREYKARGFPIGYKDSDNYFLMNHVEFKILFHQPELSVSDFNVQYEEEQVYRIVGFEVIPASIKYPDNHDSKNCEQNGKVEPFKLDTKNPVGQSLTFTYSVTFEESDLKWATRWDPLLDADPEYKSIQWFYIFNSVAIMIVLSILVAGIMLRTIYLDFARYNNLEEAEEAEDETGWKQIHGDVFRPPSHRGALSVACGTGAQLAVMTFVTLWFAHLGFFSPAYRGGLLSALIGFWVVTSVVCGYISARTYLMLGGTQKKVVTTGSAFFLSGTIFAVFFSTNLILSLAGSSAAVNFLTLVALLLIWLAISVPLNILGAFLGYKAKPIDLPARVSSAPRPIPEYTSVPPMLFAVVSGIIPFGVVFIELVFILDSLWQSDVFYMFGFLFIVFVILLVTCSEVSIVLTYLLLCREDWRWWWIAFAASGSSGLYVLLYSLYFILSHSGLQGMHLSSVFLFGGYTFVISLCFTLLTGAIGFFATVTLVRRLYMGVHMD